MKKGRIFSQMLDIIIKIMIAFVFVFVLYLISKLVNNFAYDYFIFPFLSIIIIFVCGVKVGIALERVRDNKSIGIFTKPKQEEQNLKETEFTVKERTEIITNKKILKEDEEDRVHVKSFNFDDIDHE